ncbi:MAG: hypothetical protein ACN6QY_10995 [Pseudomonas sp.]|nr:hypothetical protein [Pseudomonas sp. L5B5]UCZ83277.1 hypothetical protein LGQ10_23360 [Pseudomonas sp. L5B5]
MSATLQAMWIKGCNGFRAGYPQAVPQGLGVSDAHLDDRSMTLVKN